MPGRSTRDGDGSPATRRRVASPGSTAPSVASPGLCPRCRTRVFSLGSHPRAAVPGWAEHAWGAGGGSDEGPRSPTAGTQRLLPAPRGGGCSLQSPNSRVQHHCGQRDFCLDVLIPNPSPPHLFAGSHWFESFQCTRLSTLTSFLLKKPVWRFLRPL